MHLPDTVSVLVVGAGPTGLTTAHLLASYGVETLLIDALRLDLPGPLCRRRGGVSRGATAGLGAIAAKLAAGIADSADQTAPQAEPAQC